MNLALVSVHNHGSQLQEYVKLHALDKCNLSHYMVADTTYALAGSISNKLRHVHWFEPLDVWKNDVIFLYTRHGTDFTEVQRGIRVHHVFWNLDRPVWNDEGDVGVLLNVSWMSKPAKPMAAAGLGFLR